MTIAEPATRRFHLSITVGLIMFLFPSVTATNSFSCVNPSRNTCASSTFLGASTFLHGLPTLGFVFPSSATIQRPSQSVYNKSENRNILASLSSSSGWLDTSSPRLGSVTKANNNDQDSIDAETDDLNNPFHNNPDIPQRRLIEVSSRIELPFSVYDAYDAYADLPRQPTWSSWLDSVVIKTDNPNESVWTMKFLGIRYSWTAVAVQNKRPHTIQWKSITGLQNFGTVRFYEKDDDSTSFMTMSMTFVAPRAVSLAFQKSKALAKYVEQKMITQSLEEFRNIVSQEVNSKQRNLTSVGEE